MANWWRQESAKCSHVIDIGRDWPSIEPLVNQTVDCHHFNRCLQLMSTNQKLLSTVEDHIQSTETLSYHLVKNIPIDVLINKILINAFIKRGQLFAVSIDREVDRDDCMAVLPNGLIVLSVKESTYRRTGLVGRKSILYRNKNCVQKYIIEVDLKNDKLIPGTKLYARTLECLQRSGLVFDLFVKWEPNEDMDVSSVSIQNFFTFIKDNTAEDDGLSVKSIECFRCFPSMRKFVNKDIPIPAIDDKDVSEDEIHSVIEWFGAQMCQIDCNESQESDVSTFGVKDCETREDISCVVLNGFFSCFDVKRLLKKLRQTIDTNESMSCVIVNGFENTPIAWRGARNEHSINMSGENVYGVGWGGQVLANGLNVIWRTADEYDFGIEKL